MNGAKFRVDTMADVADLAGFLGGVIVEDARPSQIVFEFDPVTSAMDPVEFASVLSVLCMRSAILNIRVQTQPRKSIVEIAKGEPL